MLRALLIACKRLHPDGMWTLQIADTIEILKLVGVEVSHYDIKLATKLNWKLE